MPPPAALLLLLGPLLRSRLLRLGARAARVKPLARHCGQACNLALQLRADKGEGTQRRGPAACQLLPLAGAFPSLVVRRARAAGLRTL